MAQQHNGLSRRAGYGRRVESVDERFSIMNCWTRSSQGIAHKSLIGNSAWKFDTLRIHPITSSSIGDNRATMNISVKGEYALHAILDLAMYDRGAPVKIADIAKRQKIPQKFLELILAGLKQGGFVESRRGAEGGYLLARPADSITVGEVIRYMEGLKPSGSGKQGTETPFTDLWDKVDCAVSNVVDRTTFAEVTKRWKEKQGKYVPNWDI